MTTLESIYEKLTPGRIPPPPALVNPPTTTSADATRNISRDVAHELNNVMTIIRGYADRLIMKHGDNPALRPELQLISDNARRAANVVRAASQPSKTPTNIIP